MDCGGSQGTPLQAAARQWELQVRTILDRLKRMRMPIRLRLWLSMSWAVPVARFHLMAVHASTPKRPRLMHAEVRPLGLYYGKIYTYSKLVFYMQALC